MAVYFSSLNSGSNGNCYYIGNDSEAVLIDAGISCREIETRMAKMELPIEKIKAIFVSHEHADHIKGVAVLSRKHQIPVYITNATRKQAKLKLEKKLSFTFAEQLPVKIGSLVVTPFAKHHDAVDPCSFVVENQGICIGVFTDIGLPCEQTVRYFKKCHAAFLEANYDDAMLENGNYPYILKKRIRGGKGHLSNQQALDLFLLHKPAHLSHLLLSHLSKNNNDPKLVEALFAKNAGNVKTIVASRYEASAVFKLEDGIPPDTKKKPPVKLYSQLRLFFE